MDMNAASLLPSSRSSLQADNDRRMARRGGVKRISAGIYDETRSVLKKRLTEASLVNIFLQSYSDNNGS